MHGSVHSPVSDRRPSRLSCTHGFTQGTPVQHRRKGRPRTRSLCLLLSMMLTMLFAGSAFADSFQFVDSRTNTSLGYWTVHVGGQSLGSTDGMGRIVLNLERGQYQVTLRQEGKPEKQAAIVVDNSPGLKLAPVF